jgi:phenylalanyl-tRNA synthetase beta chain
MKISYNWLKDYLNINLSVEELSEILTEIGLEVSKIEKYESIKGGLEGLVIGKVLTCEKHPNADKLSVTTVDIGTKVLPIVCGAPNVAAGQKVVVATVGTKLYAGDEEWEIKKSKIRGEVSEGMICAEDEIGLGNDHEGIMVLDDNVQTGIPAKDYFDIYTDTVFEIDLTPNRPDAISHYGVARDLYAYLKLNTNLDIELKLPDISDFKIDNTNLNIDVEVRNTEACPRYTGLTLTNLKTKESPQWMQNRLKAIGLKPINNLVDITNYVLHEIGHPLHAFDADKIQGQKIIVSTVKPGTKFATLDEREIELTDKDLMICDANLTPMCIGGVMGGIESGIQENTKSVFLESAFFNPVWVRKTAKYHTISTDASYRFERGVDPNNCLWALKRCATLMKQLAEGKISSEIKDIYPEKINNWKTQLTFSHLEKLSGIKLDKDIIKKILNLLEIKITEENEEGYKLEVPTYRFEVRREADIIEEILRIYGYNRIPLPEKIETTVLIQKKTNFEQIKNKIAHLLTSRGFYEIMTFSLLNSNIYNHIDSDETYSHIMMHNPLSKELDTMRLSLIFGALDSVSRNIKYGNPNLKFFEYGSTYFKKNKEKFEEKFVQKYNLSLCITGQKETTSWKSTDNLVDFYTLKGYAELVLKAMNYDRKIFKVEESSNKIFKYCLNYYLNNQLVLTLGAVSRKFKKIYEIDQEVYFAEFQWDYLLEKIPEHKQFKELAKYPKVSRDLALLLDKNIKYEEVEKVARETDKKILKKITIFDVYEGKNLPENKKSYALNFVIQDENKTLTDKVVNKLMNKLMNNFKQKLNAEIRQ